jgi:hypothetical protein
MAFIVVKPTEVTIHRLIAVLANVFKLLLSTAEKRGI